MGDEELLQNGAGEGDDPQGTGFEFEAVIPHGHGEHGLLDLDAKQEDLAIHFLRIDEAVEHEQTERTGRFKYYCEVHPFMVGYLRVVGAHS